MLAELAWGKRRTVTLMVATMSRARQHALTDPDLSHSPRLSLRQGWGPGSSTPYFRIRTLSRRINIFVFDRLMLYPGAEMDTVRVYISVFRAVTHIAQIMHVMVYLVGTDAQQARGSKLASISHSRFPLSLQLASR